MTSLNSTPARALLFDFQLTSQLRLAVKKKSLREKKKNIGFTFCRSMNELKLGVNLSIEIGRATNTLKEVCKVFMTSRELAHI